MQDFTTNAYKAVFVQCCSHYPDYNLLLALHFIVLHCYSHPPSVSKSFKLFILLLYLKLHIFVHVYICTYIYYIIIIFYIRGSGSSVCIAIDYGLDGPGSNPGWGLIFRLSRPALRPNQSPLKWVPGLSRG